MLSVATLTLALGCLAALCVGQGAYQFEAVAMECMKFRSGGQTYSCPEGYAFSSLIKFCVPHDSFLNNQCNDNLKASDFGQICQTCMALSQGRFDCVYPTPYDCSKFINCSKVNDDDESGNLPPLADECQYPDLFDVTLNRCSNYDGVTCGSRYEPKEPCEYARNMCGPCAHCRPCWARFGSCRDKLDGDQGWSGREWTPYFTQCQNQRTLFSGTCPSSRSGQPRIFSPASNRCDDLAQIPRVFGGFQDDIQG